MNKLIIFVQIKGVPVCNSTFYEWGQTKALGQLTIVGNEVGGTRRRNPFLGRAKQEWWRANEAARARAKILVFEMKTNLLPYFL